MFGGAARQPANHKKGFYVTRVFIARYSQMRGCRKRPGGGGGGGIRILSSDTAASDQRDGTRGAASAP